MHFASPIPLWLVLGLAAASAAVAFLAYRRPLAPLSPVRRGTLATLRAAALLLLLVFLCRPIAMRPPLSQAEAVVPILIDNSRSMDIHDEGGKARVAASVAAVSSTLVPAIAKRFKPEIFVVGDQCRNVSGLASCAVAPATLGSLAATANRSDLSGAVAGVRDAYRGRRLAGIVLVSDGDDTGHEGSVSLAGSAPVFSLGVGSPAGVPDREVTGISAGDPRLDEAAVDLHVTAVSRGLGRAPFSVRLSANGRAIDTRSVAPAADGAPVDLTFTVTPDAAAPTLFTAEIAADSADEVPGNNARSVLVSPRGRKRHLLMLEGAPGFEHSFLTRALGADPDLDVDSIVRKGTNDAGQDTYFVQAPATRAPLLTSGFPARRENLYAYDAVILANLSADELTREQLTELSDFVSLRGGGLLVLGGLSFAGRGLIGTPLEPVLPVELGDRRGAVMRSSLGAQLPGLPGAVALTPEGEGHAVMRIGSSVEDTRKKWSALPPLASTAPLGGPRPGATVLAVTTVPGGATYPLVAVQPYGQGRSMIFGGEASWRWRMLMPLSDRSYEFFWRQAARWLAGPSPDAIALRVPEVAQPGDALSLDAEVRDAAFAAVDNASVTGTLAAPDGDSHPLAFRRDAGGPGRFTASVQTAAKGVYHAELTAVRGTTKLGTADRWFYVGGTDRELADPRLNEDVLRRIARATGGRYAPLSRAADVASWLDARQPAAADLEPHDLWQAPWTFALAVALLAAEWILRRRWGLR